MFFSIQLASREAIAGMRTAIANNNREGETTGYNQWEEMLINIRPTPNQTRPANKSSQTMLTAGLYLYKKPVKDDIILPSESSKKACKPKHI